MNRSNDREDLVVVTKDRERTYEGTRLQPAQMLWQCTTQNCLSPIKIRRRGQYQDKLICNICSNRIKSKDPIVLANRGKAISKAIAERGDQWSVTATKNMSVQATRDKISESVTDYIAENPEAIEIRRETALKNNEVSGFGTSEFGKNIWDSLTDEERKTRVSNALTEQAISLHDRHVRLAKLRFPDFTVLTFNDDGVYQYMCPKEHIFLQRSNNFIKRGNCPFCTPKSSMEIKVYDFIKDLLPNIERNRRVLYRDDTKNGNNALEIDLYDEERKFGIELHGLYWHQEAESDISIGVDRSSHRLKAELADKHDIKLLQFFEDEINEQTDIVESVIKAKLGIFQHKIYARECTLKEVDYKTASAFLNANHLQGQCRGTLRLGLWYKDELVSLLTFRTPRVNEDEKTVEIARFCSKLNWSVGSGFDRLLASAEKSLKANGIDTIMTYADRRYSHGEVYERNKFQFVEFTEPDMHWCNKESRFPRQISWKKGDAAMKEEGYWKIYGTGNSKWIKKI